MFTAEGPGEAHEMLQLNRAERLLVTALRRLVLGWGMCTGIARELEASCGPQASEVMATLRIFLGTLDRTARRQLTIAQPGWFAPTVDERRMLAMVSAAQRGDEGWLGALVCWFARSEEQPLLVQASHLLADALAVHNLRISGRRADAGEPSAMRGELRLVS